MKTEKNDPQDGFTQEQLDALGPPLEAELEGEEQWNVEYESDTQRHDDTAACPPPAIDDTMPHCVGALVVAENLASATHLNGQTGEIIDAQGERWGVRFDNHSLGVKALRARNLRVLGTARAASSRPATPPCPSTSSTFSTTAASRRRRRDRGTSASAAAASTSSVASAPSPPTPAPPARRQRRVVESPTPGALRQ